MAYSYNVTVASGSTDLVAVPFPFLSRAHVHVTLDGEEVDAGDLTWLSDSQIQLPSTPAVGTVVRVYRETPAEGPLVEWPGRAVLTSADLNNSAYQNLYIAQEAIDGADVSQATADELLGLVDGITETHDAVTTLAAEVEADADAAEAARAAAVVAQTAAEAAQTAAETAETNAEAAQTAAETAQGLAETAKTAAEAAQTAAETAETNAEAAALAASNSETAAQTAETNAETAETNAETAQAAAEAARDLAQGYATSAAEAAAMAPDIILRDIKSSGTSGGSFTSGARRTRDLNTEERDANNICTLSSNQFTLPAGTYWIEWDAPAYRVEYHRSWLYNVTDAADAIVGSGEYASNTLTLMNWSRGRGLITIADTKTFEIQHECTSTQTTNGMGQANGIAGPVTYTSVYIWEA